MAVVTAKFKVQRVTPQSKVLAKDHETWRDAAEVEMVPDYAEGKNKDWSEYTPSGVIRMNVNGPALQHFTEGAAFTVVFKSEDED